jgi:heat shock protein HslJ
MDDVADLEDSIRQTLHARVSHLAPERLKATDVATPTREQGRQSVRRMLLPVAAAAAVVAVAVGVAVDMSAHSSRHISSPPARTRPGNAGLAGTEWRLAYFASNDASHTPPAGVVATIGFNQVDGIYGSDGCNDYGGPVTVGASTIKVGLLGSTDMYCSGARGSLSTAFDHLVSRANHWARTGSELTLTTPDRWIVVFRQVPHGTIHWPGSAR